MDSKDFFTNASKGKYDPLIYHEPEFTPSNKNVWYFYHNFKNKFDDHINASIPLYLETQLSTIDALLKTDKKIKVLDIGSSNATWAKTLAYIGTSSKIDVTVLDPNDDILEPANEMRLDNFHVENKSFVFECCNKDIYDTFENAGKFDVIKESMSFQFISQFRSKLVDEVYYTLAEDGLFLTEEKFEGPRENEFLKDTIFKSRYFKDDDIENKKEIIDDMKIVKYKFYVNILKGYFRFVYVYYRAGNFVGLACSNSKSTIQRFIKNFENGSKLKNNEFNVERLMKFNVEPDIKTFVNDYNSIVKHDSIFDLEKAEHDNIFKAWRTHSHVFFALSKTGEFKHLYKAPYVISNKLVELSIVARLNECRKYNLHPHVNMFEFQKSLIEIYKKYGFEIRKIETYKDNSDIDDIFLKDRPNIVYMENCNVR